MLRYALPGHDETRIDLFIYPFGQDRAEAALDHGMRDFVASLRTAEREGRFRALSMSDAVAFDLGQAPADGDGPGKRRRDRRGSGDADVERMLMEALAAVDRRIRGRRLDLAFEYPGQVEGDWFAMHSRGYLFYRHLYFFKGRVSATAARIDRGRFAALADRAMRDLVPACRLTTSAGAPTPPSTWTRDSRDAKCSRCSCAGWWRPRRRWRRATAATRPTRRNWPRCPTTPSWCWSSTPPTTGATERAASRPAAAARLDWAP